MQLHSDSIARAATRLAQLLTPSELDQALARAIPESLIIKTLLPPAATKLERASLLVEATGTELLRDRELRRCLLRGNPLAAGRIQGKQSSAKAQVAQVAGMAWHPGKVAATRFCDALEFPSEFAGVPTEPAPPDLERVEPPGRTPALEDFQQDLVNQLLDVMELRAKSAAMMSLPTGAGKTLTAMSAIVSFQDRCPDAVIVWLATTEEICEQAVQTYLRLRRAMPPRTVTQVQRFWGSHALDTAFERGIIVASVQKIYSRLDGDAIPHRILRAIKVVFFDEGHHVIAPTYLEAIRLLRGGARHGEVPLIGLTATPGRGSDPNSEASRRLAKEFGFNLLVPRLDGWHEPVAHLQKRSILSHADFIVVRTGREFSMDTKMAQHWKEFGDFSPEFLKQVAIDADRNAMILGQALQPGTSTRGLIYACSVSHAEHLAFLLRRQGRQAECISSNTRAELRHRAIERFKNGALQFLTNFGVLTTGFDAPATDLIVLARPVASQVLYEQMLGRGLRGPHFGGTERCTIVDFEDSVELHGAPLAYRRFLNVWGAHVQPTAH